ncbi:hypothetical protein LPTSP4_34800 [Leptospira ryugenii]|uniref:Uncharacterized protein n=1 Tax=Leptospira ryugenii TaxID=1917863 RepID=A0A2P2E4Z8_9LEPT|nr:hypothetical protein [Leptospira ryugenii]GBF51942.1 hypothetical protein LPTSP4_34800 [Leptospira ryugenii]
MPWQQNQKYGSFKKLLIPTFELEREAGVLREELTALRERSEKESIHQAEICFSFLRIFLTSRLGRRAYLRTGKPLPPLQPLLPFLEEVRFFGMPDTVRGALFHWLKDNWKLQLIYHHPSGKEMLEAQSEGIRLLTIDWEAALSGQLVEGKRDAFEHLLHDLAHAYMFFRLDYDYEGQVKFFQRLYEVYEQYSPFLESNLSFREKFEYCISDMNSHPAHLESYWRAICKESNVPLYL